MSVQLYGQLYVANLARWFLGANEIPGELLEDISSINADFGTDHAEFVWVNLPIALPIELPEHCNECKTPEKETLRK